MPHLGHNPRHVRRVVGHEGQAHPLNRGEAAKAHDRLDEFNQEPEAQIDDHKELEAIANACGHARADDQHGAETGENDDLVQLRGVPGDPVAEIHPPWQPRRNSVGLVFEAGKKTANPSDRDTEHERQGEEVAGCDAYAPQALDRLDGDQSADQPTDDRLSAEDEPRLEPVVRQKDRILKSRQDAASSESTDHRRDNPPPARAGINHISALTAEAAVEVKARGVGKALEYPVRMDGQRPQMEVRRKTHAPPRNLRAGTPRSLARPTRSSARQRAAAEAAAEPRSRSSRVADAIR